MKVIRLRPGKERSVLRRHPWIFDTAIEKGKADSGETVRIESSEGKFLAWAAFSPTSKIRARAWSFDEHERIDAAFFVARCERAIAARSRMGLESSGIRLIHGEADGLPGLIVDRYGDTLVAQFLSAGAEARKKLIADALLETTGLTRLYERSDASTRKLEGLEPITGWLRGSGDVALTIREHDWELALHIEQGHKTGFYLDQRDNRHKFSQYAERLQFRTLLNCYCYTGGFTVAALAGLQRAGAVKGAKLISIDSSGTALEKARANVELNGMDASVCEFIDADVNASLREYIKSGQRFDAIILDPPKFAPSAAHADRASRAYKDINRLAFKLLEPGGVLFTFSCSGGIGAELFHKIVAGAAMDAHVDGYILDRLQGACDHPTTMNFPEGEYLKGLVVMKTQDIEVPDDFAEHDEA
jgi:23S rRNA (cytosine1962-C5)-methyltransferase